MSIVKLNGGFSMMAEGINVLRIIQASYSEDFGNFRVTLTDSKNHYHFEKFDINSTMGCNALSAFARAAYNDPSIQEVDTDLLIGKYVKMDIYYRSYTDANGNPKKATTRVKGSFYQIPTEDEIQAFEAEWKPRNTTSAPAPKAEPAEKKPTTLEDILG